MASRNFKTPCIVCGKLTAGSNRCELHLAEQKARDRARLSLAHQQSTKRDKYKGDYNKRAREIKRVALEYNLDCPLCGLPLATGGKLHADHVYPELGNDSPLQAVHAICNLRKGNRSPKSPNN